MSKTPWESYPTSDEPQLLPKSFNIYKDDYERLKKVAAQKRCQPAYLLRVALAEFLAREDPLR